MGLLGALGDIAVDKVKDMAHQGLNGAKNAVNKFNEISQIPFRKANTYLMNQIKQHITDEPPKPTEVPHKYMDRNTRIREFKSMIEGRRIPLSLDDPEYVNKNHKRKKAKLAVQE